MFSDKGNGLGFAGLVAVVATMVTLYVHSENKSYDTPVGPSQKVPVSQIDTFPVWHGPFSIFAYWDKNYTLPLSDTTLVVPMNKLNRLHLDYSDTVLVSKNAKGIYIFDKK
jgi:hypothetical protein